MSENDLVCPIDGTELEEQNYDFDCPKCGAEFEDGDGAITKRQYDLLRSNAYDKLLSAAKQMHFEIISHGLIPLAEMVDRFGNKNEQTSKNQRPDSR